MPLEDERWAQADPRYTVTPTFFGACLAFFGKHYNVVSGHAVCAACRGEGALPERALLVTLDDGWADTAEYALPVLQEHGLPATVFVPPPVIDSGASFWQERVYGGWKAGTLPETAIGDDLPGEDDRAIRALIRRLSLADEKERSEIVEALTARTPRLRRQMLTRAQLRQLYDAGIELGAHGMSHEPLAGSEGAAEEMREARVRLSELLGGAAVTSMSFPHGSYDDAVLEIALRTYDAVYTSDGTLNVTTDGALRNRSVARIGIPGEVLSDDGARLSPDLLALWLFRRPLGETGLRPGERPSTSE